MRQRARISARRARDQAERIGSEISLARADAAMTRAVVARRAGVSADTERRIEGGDPAVQIDTLCAVGSAVGLDIVVRAYPARPPSLRDSGQLVMAEQLAAITAPSWSSVLEAGVGKHGEAVDVALFGPREIISLELERLILDFQAQYRRAARKRDELARRHSRPARLVLVIEDTRRNRAAVAEHAGMIGQVFPAGSREVLRALRTGRSLGQDGVMWMRRRAPPRR